MAIVIPSSKTYDRQNPKVRDNVIERMEVGAVEVLPNNEYETPVYNENINLIFNGEWQTDVDIYGNTVAMSNSYYQRGAFVGIKTYNIENYEIKIPKIEKNKYILKIYEKTNKNEENYIKTSLRYKRYNGALNVELLHKKAPNITTNTNVGDVLPATQNNLYINYSNIVYEQIPIEETTVDLIKDNLTVKEEISAVGENKQLVAKVEGIDKTNLATVDIDGTDEKFYKCNISILIGYEKYYGLQIDELNPSDEIAFPAIVYLNKPHNVTLNAEKIITEKLEITFYGNTIGIDLTDKNVYINGQTAKKVHSIDGNELMQTSNYIKDENGNITENAIGNMYGETCKEYALGKETATIRCSISDYYDYDSGDKVISIDNSTNKMSFKMYDQVIPMVYGADGKDRPMSTYQDGSPKVFQVLGSNIYYDGAVWQELSLQEV